MPFHPVLQAIPDQLADDAMGFPKGDTFLHQVVGQLGGQEKAGPQGSRKHVPADAKTPDQLGIDRETLYHSSHGVKKRLFIFLQVSIVTQG